MTGWSSLQAANGDDGGMHNGRMPLRKSGRRRLQEKNKDKDKQKDEKDKEKDEKDKETENRIKIVEKDGDGPIQNLFVDIEDTINKMADKVDRWKEGFDDLFDDIYYYDDYYYDDQYYDDYQFTPFPTQAPRKWEEKGDSLSPDKFKPPNIFAPSFTPKDSSSDSGKEEGRVKNPFNKKSKAEKFKEKDDSEFGGKILGGLKNKKSKSKKKSKKHKKKKKFNKFEISWNFVDRDSGERLPGIYEYRCPEDSEDLHVPDKEGDIPGYDDIDHLLCHHIYDGLNYTENAIDHKFFHEQRPSIMPSVSHAPSVSMKPSIAPSISFAPSTSPAPSKTPKDLICKQRSPTAMPAVSSGQRRLGIHSPAIQKPIKLKDRELQTPEQQFTAAEFKQILKQAEEQLAIDAGWNPEGPNDRPRFWYLLPYCDEMPTTSPNPSSTFAPSMNPSATISPTATLSPSVIPTNAQTTVPTTSVPPSMSIVPSSSPTVPGYKGPLRGFGCDMFTMGVDDVAVGQNVEVNFIYQLTTTVFNVSDSNALTYVEDEMQNYLTPLLLGCGGDNTNGRKLQENAVLYLLPRPEDEIFSNECVILDSTPENGQQCVQVLSKMNAIVDENGTFSMDQVNIEVLRAAKSSMEDNVYVNPDEGIIRTDFMGILTTSGSVEVPSALITEDVVERDTVTAWGSIFITLIVAAFIFVIFGLAKRKQRTQIIEMEELTEDEWEFDKTTPTKGIRDDATDRTGFSSPESNISADLDATPRKYVNVLDSGNRRSCSIVDDLRDTEARLDSLKTGRLKTLSEDDGLKGFAPTMNVHNCNSATCEICKPWKNQDPTFISTLDETSKASPNAKAPKLNYKLNRKRAYKMDDTVVL